MMIWDSVKGMWFIEHDGHRRYLARLPLTQAKRRSYGIQRAAVNLIPESQWEDVDLAPYCSPIKDQDGEGACVAFSGTYVHEGARALAGMTPVQLSCGHLYGQINGGSDNGAVVEDALKALEQVGQCTTATVDDMTWQTRKWPAAAQTEAVRFKVEIGGEVTTFEEIVSLLQVRKLVAIGIDVGRNFNPDRDGILPDQAGSGGGHGLAVFGCKRIGGQMLLKIPNSWGPRWGAAGWCYMPRSYIDRAGGGHYHVDACRDDPQDASNPAIAA